MTAELHDLRDDEQGDRDCANCGELLYGFAGDICDECQLGWYEVAFDELRKRVADPHSAADLAELVYSLLEEAKQRMGSNAPGLLSAQQIADRENGSLL